MKLFTRIFALVAMAFMLAACDKAPSNIFVLSTSDCGASWKTIGAGQPIPKAIGTCTYNTSLPNWTMAGDTEFRTQFQKNVASKVTIAYMYEIEDPLKYIGEARFLGKMGADLELSASNIGNRYEMAENIIIDKTIREITVDLSRNLDLTNLDLKKYESDIEDKVKPIMKKKGLAVSDMAVVIEPDEMTRIAIDTVSAKRIFDSADMTAQGMDVMKARASAARIEVVQKNEEKSK